MTQQETPKPLQIPQLLDASGQPLPGEIQRAFESIAGKFRRTFSALQDDAVVRNLFDRAGQLYLLQLLRQTRIRRAKALAWTILANLAHSELRRSELRVQLGTINSREAERAIHSGASKFGTPEQIIASVLAREIYEQLTDVERVCVTLKTTGWSSKEVAAALGMTPGAVDKLMQRMRARLQDEPEDPKQSKSTATPTGRGKTESMNSD